jgi:hypothetical protein
MSSIATHSGWRCRRARASSRELALEALLPGTAVGQAGQLVGQREALELPEQLGALLQHAHEAPDLLSERAEDLACREIGLPHLRAEELDDAAKLAPGDHRHAQRRVQAGAPGDARARKAGVARQVGRPRRLTGRPHASGQRNSPLELEPQADLLELRRRVPGAPDRAAAQDLAVVLRGRPPRAQLPSHRLAERGQQPAHRLLAALRLREYARDRVLRAQQALGQPALGDVVHERVEAWSGETFLA